MFVDYYEALQISPNADQETVHRVYRVQAQRFHPDNRETGDAELFRVISDAYQTLSDPQKRSAYDAQHRVRHQPRQPQFDTSAPTAALHDEHPHYGWVNNKGYGTQEHLVALNLHGPTRHHRRSFAPVHNILYGGQVEDSSVTL